MILEIEKVQDLSLPNQTPILVKNASNITER